MEEKLMFSTVFFKIYDRKIRSGEIAFKDMGMPKNDFTLLCTTPDYVPEADVIRHICISMKLDEEETALFKSFIEEA